MPSLNTTSRSNLETERNNFLLHEQRIIQERDEILRNIHNHLEQLDAGKFILLRCGMQNFAYFVMLFDVFAIFIHYVT